MKNMKRYVQHVVIGLSLVLCQAAVVAASEPTYFVLTRPAFGCITLDEIADLLEESMRDGNEVATRRLFRRYEAEGRCERFSTKDDFLLVYSEAVGHKGIMAVVAIHMRSQKTLAFVLSNDMMKYTKGGRGR